MEPTDTGMRIERGPRFGKAHAGPAHVARLASKGKYILSGGADGRVCLWNASSPPPDSMDKDGLHEPIESYKAASREVLAIDVAHDNATFVSAGNDRTVVLWDVVTASPVRRLQGNTGGRTHAVLFAGHRAFSSGPFRPDGSVLAVGGFDRVVRMFDLRAPPGRPLMELSEATDAVLALATREHTLVSGSVDGVVRTYDIRAGNLTADDVGDPVTSVELDEESRMLVTALHAPPRLLSTTDGSLLSRLEGASHKLYRCHAGILPDGVAALGGGEDGQVYLWDTQLTSRLPSDPAKTLALSALKPPVSTAHHSPPSSHSRPVQVLWSELVSWEGSLRGVSAGTDGSVQVWRMG